MKLNDAARVLWVLVFACLPIHAETKTIVEPPGLIEIRLPDAKLGGDAVDVSWDPRQPIDLDYRSYENGSVAVFHASSGRVVIVSDVIYWDQRRREKTTWIVTVGDGPGPPGPNPPDPGPGPSPPQPPSDIENRLGVGIPVYQAASRARDKSNSKSLATEFRAISSRLHQGLILPREANEIATSHIQKLPPAWNGFAKSLADAMRDSLKEHGVGIAIYRDLYYEAALALEAYSQS